MMSAPVIASATLDKNTPSAEGVSIPEALSRQTTSNITPDVAEANGVCAKALAPKIIGYADVSAFAASGTGTCGTTCAWIS